MQAACIESHIGTVHSRMRHVQAKDDRTNLYSRDSSRTTHFRRAACKEFIQSDLKQRIGAKLSSGRANGRERVLNIACIVRSRGRVEMSCSFQERCSALTERAVVVQLLKVSVASW